MARKLGIPLQEISQRMDSNDDQSSLLENQDVINTKFDLFFYESPFN